MRGNHLCEKLQPAVNDFYYLSDRANNIRYIASCGKNLPSSTATRTRTMLVFRDDVVNLEVTKYLLVFRDEMKAIVWF